MAATFDVVFQGQIVEGRDPAQVRANLAKLFKADAARIEALFAASSTVIKKGIDEVTARNYQAALAKAGATVHVIAAATGPAPAAEPAPAVAANPLTIAEPGVLLIEPIVTAPAQFDTTAFSLADVGVTLVEPTPVAPPQFDLSALDLAPVGTVLVEATPVKPAKIDTSGLSLVDR